MEKNWLSAESELTQTMFKYPRAGILKRRMYYFTDYSFLRTQWWKNLLRRTIMEMRSTVVPLATILKFC